MARFQYVAVDPDGRKRSGGLDAIDEAAARADLRSRQLLPVQLGPAGHTRAKEEASTQMRASGRMSHKVRLLITRQLATLIDAAVPVDEALGMIAAQQENAFARRVMSDVQTGVVEGMRLADALGRHPESFSGLYRAAVSGGERAGRLGFVLNRLADHLGRSHAMRSKIQTAMIYPAALSAVALVVVLCLMIFVVPSLTEQFRNFDAQLPLLTQMLIWVSEFLSTYWLFLLIGLAAAAFFLQRVMRQETARYAVDAAILRAPIIGRWAVAVNASRFVRSVATLVTSGMPVLESVRAAAESVENRAARRQVARMSEWIEQGEPLSSAMRRSGVIPVMVAYMAASGENAGELPNMLDKAADHLDQEFEAFTATALSLLEPAIIVLMGVVVASIVLAIMLPVLQLNRLATG